MFKKLTLPGRIFISFLILIFFVLLLSGSCVLLIQMRTTSAVVDSSIKEMSIAVTSNPDVKQAFEDGKVSDETMRYLDGLVKNERSVDYIVLAKPDGIRLYHPDHSMIGKHFSGGDEKKAIEGSGDYITDGKGSREYQRRYFSSMKDDDGNVLGFVMVSRYSRSISELKQRQMIYIIGIFIISVIMAGIIALIVGRRLQKQLLGYEPSQIARMFMQREEVLDGLEEGLLLINERGVCEYSNESAIHLLRTDDSDRISEFVDEYVSSYIASKESVSKQTIRWTDHTLLMDILPAESKRRYIGSLVVLRDKTETTKMAAQLTGIDQLIGALRASTHETKNRMHVILGLLQIGETDEAISYIQSSVEEDEETSNIRHIIKNNTLAALLIGKRNRARELDIDFKVRKDSYLDKYSKLLTSADLVTIIGNLIENSFDAMEDVHDRDREVTLFVKEDENGLLISVDDTGCGMPEEIRSKLMNETVTTKGEGHGIGTGLIRNILRGFDSSVEIESVPDEGTLINIMIKASDNSGGQN